MNKFVEIEKLFPPSTPARVSSRVFQLGGGGGVPAILASQILYLITTLGKSLTRPFPGIAIKQRIWSARLGFSRSSTQRDLSMTQCIPLALLEKGDFGSCRGGQSQKIWRGGT